MSTLLTPYLNFRNNAREAMEFYQGVFGGKLELRTFKEFHAAHDPSEEDLIMHSTLKTDNGMEFHAADTPKDMEYSPGGSFAISVVGDDGAELKGYFDKLSASSTVTMPFSKAMWGDMFGMCTDKFGVRWLIDAPANPAA